jgi:hypothetical protein
MVSHIKIPTLQTLVVVEDSNLPSIFFAVEGRDNEERSLYQYVRLDTLPEELKEAVRKAVLP